MNLVVAEDLGAVTMSEVTRVLCPGGVAYVKSARRLERRRSSRGRTEIDDWTHYLHDATQQRPWRSDDGRRPAAAPAMGRQDRAGLAIHDHMASMQCDGLGGGPDLLRLRRGAHRSNRSNCRPTWSLTARDAFNGTSSSGSGPLHQLVQRPLSVEEWPRAGYPGDWWPSDDRVYVARGAGQEPPVPRRGSRERSFDEYDDTASTFELIVSEGVVFAAVDADQEACDYYQQHPDCWKERSRASIRSGHGFATRATACSRPCEPRTANSSGSERRRWRP